MDYYSSQISKLIQELSSLPGIGAKSAQRLAFHILNMPVEQVEELSSSIVDARKNVRYCKECFTLTDDELCPICKDAGRNQIPEILQHMKKPANTTGFIMSCMGQFLRCLESDLQISS